MHGGILGPSHLKNSDDNLVDFSTIGEHTPSTLVHNAKHVGRSDVV